MADTSKRPIIKMKDSKRPVVKMKKDWVHEDFDEWSELTKERDGYREDAIAEMHRRDREGF